MTVESCSPVLPTASAAVRVRPLGLRRNRVTGGFWADLRQQNRDRTIPHGAAQLEAAGNLSNFRLAVAGRHDGYMVGADDAGTPFPFLDSDVYKWLEAVGWALSDRMDPELLALADPVIDLVARAQREDGYLNSYFQVAAPQREFTDFQWGHELYTIGHLVQASIAWHRATGDDRLLEIGDRALDRIETELGPGGREVVEGHPEIEMALVERYRTTGRERDLELARLLVERRGRGLLGPGRLGDRYWQDHQPVREARDPVGHAVRQVYLDCGVVDLATELGDLELLASAVIRWEALTRTRMYLTGGLGARHRDEALGDAYELPPDRAYAETCAAIGSVMLAWRLLLATGEARYADVMERTMYNAVVGGIGLNGDRFAYSNPLQRRTTGALVAEGATATLRSPWFACSCCPPNLMRFVASMPDLVATEDDAGIQVHHLVSGTVEGAADNGARRVRVETGYPWSGEASLVVESTGAAPWTVALRVPDWASSHVVLVNGTPASIALDDGWLRVDRAWVPGDRMEFSLPVVPRFTLPDPRIDAVRGTVALERGPIVYALEGHDLQPGTVLEAVSVASDASVATASDPLLRLPGAGPELEVAATIADLPDVGAVPYHEAGSPEAMPSATHPVRVRAIPFFATGNRGATAMRVWIPTPDRGS
jgi:uncharacterized protein